MDFQFGLDQIPASFIDIDFNVTGPGVWLGEMSLTGVVPSVTVITTDGSYSF